MKSHCRSTDRRHRHCPGRRRVLDDGPATTRASADVHAQLATLRYADAESDRAAKSKQSLATRAPRADGRPDDRRRRARRARDGRLLARRLRRDRAEARRQRRHHRNRPGDPAADRERRVRASQAATDRIDTVRRLDAVVKGYAEVLKAPAADCAAATAGVRRRARSTRRTTTSSRFARASMTAKTRTGAAKSPRPGPSLKALDESDLPTGHDAARQARRVRRRAST